MRCTDLSIEVNSLKISPAIPLLTLRQHLNDHSYNTQFVRIAVSKIASENATDMIRTKDLFTLFTETCCITLTNVKNSQKQKLYIIV